jgi:predicted membrane chloride channel (bestrophin family)
METSNPETLKFSSLTALRSGLTQPARGPVVMLYSLTLHVTVFTCHIIIPYHVIFLPHP